MVTSMGQLNHVGPLVLTVSGPDFILYFASLGLWLPAVQFQVLMG